MILVPVKTKDGSFTLHSKEYNEHYHSLKDGALKESLYKHVIPGFQYENNESKDKINILDICFGLGFNTLTTLYYADLIGYKGKINIYSPEKNQDLIKSLSLLPYPAELLQYLPVISAVSKGEKYDDGRITVEVYQGDAIEYVQNFANHFHVVYQDAFSSKKNPELWSKDFFRSLYHSLKNGGVLTTYSQARGVRETMEKSGFILGEQSIDADLGIRKGTIGLKQFLI